MNYEAFLLGLTDELEKAAKEDGGEAWHPTPDEKKGKKEKDEDEDEDKKDDKKNEKKEQDAEKEAADMSSLEVAFFNGLIEELEKDAGWRDLGAGRIAKMKANMATGLKKIRGQAAKSLKATGQTGTNLYSVGEKRKPGGKFYEQYGGKGFKERKRDPSRRTGPKFQARVQEAMKGRGLKPSGPSIGSRLSSWGSGIKKKISGAARSAGSSISGAAKTVGQEAVGAKGALTGGLRGAAEGAREGRAKALSGVRSSGNKITQRAKITPVLGQEESAAA
jgi:hypothetical protein